MELVAAINLVRLTQKGQGTSENVHKADQVLLQIRHVYWGCYRWNRASSMNSQALGEQTKGQVDILKDWYWIKGECNPADLGTINSAKRRM